MQAHFGTDPVKGLGEEMRIAHPGFQGAEGVLDGFPSNPHALGGTVQALLHGLEHFLMFPTSNTAVLAGRTFCLKGTLLAGRTPITV